MRLVHTADWHLGLDFYEFARLPEQVVFLAWLADTLCRLEADVLLVAGDVFNTISPSIAAQRAYFDFLTEVTRRLPHLQIVITAGNHDSGSRLEAPSALLANLNIHIKGSVLHNPEDYSINYEQFAIPLYDKKGIEYLCLAVPFLRTSDCPPKQDETEDYVEAFYRELANHFAHDKRPKICMGHLYAHGSALNEEKDIEYVAIGGLEGSSLAQHFISYSYVALGHIHRQQRIYDAENIRYSGAPIATTFSHREQAQGILVVDIEGQKINVTHEVFDSPLKLLKLTGTPVSILEQLRALSEGTVDDFAPILDLEITDTTPPPALFKQEVEEALKGRYARRGLSTFKQTKLIASSEEREPILSTLDHRYEPEEIAEREYQKRYGMSFPDDLRRLLREAIQEAQQCES